MSRAQSTVVGTILLVAVVVVTLTTFGLFSFASVGGSADGPVVDVTATLATGGVTLVHGGGDALDATALAVHVRNDSDGAVFDFEHGSLSGGDDRFEPGDRWTNESTLPPGDRLTIWLIHEPSNTVLFRGRQARRTVVPVPTPVPNDPPTASFDVSCTELVCEFDAGTPPTRTAR